MRVFLLISFLFFHITSALGQKDHAQIHTKNYGYDQELIKQNKIEEIIIEIVSSDGNNSSGSTLYFNPEGLLIKQTNQDSLGILKQEYSFISNSYGDLIVKIEKDFEYNTTDTINYFKHYFKEKLIKDSSSQLPMSYDFKYAQNGKVQEKTINTNLGLGYKSRNITTYQFDSSNRVINIKETVFRSEEDMTGTLMSNRDVYYNESGKVEKELENVLIKNSLIGNHGSINYEYDNSGNLALIQKEKGASFNYRYNDKGLILTELMKINIGRDQIIETDTRIKILYKYSYKFR